MVKITAEGKVKGRVATLTFTEQNGVVTLFEDGKKLAVSDIILMELYSYTLQRYVDTLKKAPRSYNPPEGTIEAYWLALHETYFDEPPKIKVEGELDTFGAPYSGEDTSEVVF